MVRTSIFLSLAAAATSALAAGAHEKAIVKTVVPGAYIFELEDGHVSHLSLLTDVMHFNGIEQHCLLEPNLTRALRIPPPLKRRLARTEPLE